MYFNIKKENEWTDYQFKKIYYKLNLNGNTVSFLSNDARNQFIKSLSTLESSNKKRSFEKSKAIFLNLSCKQYSEVGNYFEGLAKVEFQYKWGFIDQEGKEIVPCRYDDVYRFQESMAAVRLNNKWGFIDKEGKEIVPCQYDNVYSFQKGMAAVCLDNKWGFINKEGKEIVPYRYNKVCSFQKGMAAVCLDNKWGFIDKEGKEIVPYRYDNVYSFQEGKVKVCLDNKWGVINESGKEIIPCIYDKICIFDNVIIANDQDKVILLTKEGTPLTQTFIIESLEDLKKLPLNVSILSMKEKVGLKYDQDNVWFDTLEEQENFIQEVSVDSDFSLKKVNSL